MDKKAVVQIVGSPVACEEGYQDAWRDAAEWASGQLIARFGDAVQVDYFDLFDPVCPPLPPDAQLPLILVDGQVLINGGKISIPLIRKRLLELGLEMKAG